MIRRSFLAIISVVLVFFRMFTKPVAFRNRAERRAAVRMVGGHKFHDPALAHLAGISHALGATMAATTATAAPAQEAGRAQPQTTVEPPGGPFIRHTQPGRRSQYTVTGVAFSGLVTAPLVAVPGYTSRFRMKFTAGGGSGSTTVAIAADAPYSAVSLVTLRDAFGTPLIVGPGYEMLYLVPKYSSQFGLGTSADPKALPSYSAPVVGASASGNFTFATALPLEFAKAYGVISMANASLLPTLSIQLAAASAVYTTAPTTPPTMQIDVEADFYWLPEGVQIEPPGLGTTCQWVMQNCNPGIPSASSIMVTLPRLGGFLHTIILVMRDSTGARIDGYGTKLRVYVDGVPLLDTLFSSLTDDMAIQYGLTPNYTVTVPAGTRDTGVVAISRRTSLNQMNLGLLDTGESYLSTNPGTLVQIECSPWGTISNAPAILEAIIGQVVPAGSLLQGLPEL